MSYEKGLREEGTYTEVEIQTKISKMLKELAGLTFKKLKEDNRYKKLNIEECKTLIKELEGFEKHKKSHIKTVKNKIDNLQKDINNNKHKKPLEIDEDQLSNFECILKFPEMKQKLINKIGHDEAQEVIKELETVYNIAHTALKSKQCNEPYEILLSDVLHLENIDDKHGFDAVDSIKDTKEVYEYKPSSNTNNPGGTINDDSIKKIEKCESLKQDGTGGWLILAGIDKQNYTINIIYKFPLEIYNEARRVKFATTKKNNATKDTQTRSDYPVSIKNSIKLCNEFNLDYYIWER